MIEYVKTNITWIKDVVGGIVSIITVTIAFFTYRKAKSTIFQPLRTEVIKHQMALFEKIVDIIDPVTFIEYIDYRTIAAANLYVHLRKYGCTLGEETDNEIDDSIGGEMIINASNVTIFPPLLSNAEQIDGPYYPLPKSKDEADKNKDEALKGIIEIDEVVLTKEHIKSMDELKSIRDNPWLPKAIFKEINSLIDDVNFNLHDVLPRTLVFAIQEFCEATKSLKEPPKAILPGKVLNYVLTNGKSHEKKLKNLQKKMRKHLRVDYKW